MASPGVGKPLSNGETTFHLPATRQQRLIAESLLVSVLLLGLLCAYFWQVVFGGLVLAPTDLIFQFPFFREAAPPGFEHARNPLLSDPVLKFYPWHLIAREAVQNGEFPFWNPYIYAGAPLFANGESAVLYPFNVLGYLLPLPEALALSAILRTFVAGLGMFLFLRTLKAGRFGSLVAAVTFMFGSSMTVWLNYPIGNAYAWMPLLFFLGERLVASRGLLYPPLISIVIAVQILGGHYQVSFAMLLAWGLYCLFRLIGISRSSANRRHVTALVLLLASSTVVGFMLTAVQLIPFWEWLKLGNEVQIRTEQRSASLVDPSFWKDVVTLITFVLPNSLGNPTWGSPLSFFHSNYIEQMGYMGIVPLTLAMSAVMVARSKATPIAGQQPQGNVGPAPQSALSLFLAGMGLFFLGLALRLPILDLVNQLPVFNIVAIPRYRLVYTFCVAVLAGIGAGALFGPQPDARIYRRVKWGLLTFAAAAVFFLITVYWIVLNSGETLSSYNRLRELYPILTEAFSPGNLSMYFPVPVACLFAGTLTLHRQYPIRAELSMTLVLGLVLLDLFTFGAGFNPAIPQSQVFPQTRATQFLRDRPASQSLDRIVAMRDDLPPSTGSPYQLYEVAGTDFPTLRYAELAQAAGGYLPDNFRIAFSELQPKLINLMNVRYLIASVKPSGLDDKQLREVYHDSSVSIYENPECLPRAYLVHRARVLSEAASILATLKSADFDPRAEIILEEPPPTELSGHATRTDDLVQITRYRFQQVSLRTESADDGLLFLSDSYYPGWQAFVDGKEAKVYRANYAFRAVYLPKGNHEVRFVFAPSGLTLGLAVSIAGAALILIGLATGWKWRRLPPG